MVDLLCSSTRDINLESIRKASDISRLGWRAQKYICLCFQLCPGKHDYLIGCTPVVSPHLTVHTVYMMQADLIVAYRHIHIYKDYTRTFSYLPCVMRRFTQRCYKIVLDTPMFSGSECSRLPRHESFCKTRLSITPAYTKPRQTERENELHSNYF